MNNSILISRNVRLTYKLTAKAIYVSNRGEVTIVLERFGPKITEIPELSVDYLDALCSKFYYGGYTHANAIADILLLNSAISTAFYDDFYESLHNNLMKQRITIISSELFL